jgi:hypothetical protein
MEFANPTALFWGLLAIPIVIFYILKIRLRRVPVSTVMFWDQIFEEKRPRSIWQRLRHLLSLLLQLAFLALLVGALIDPSFSWEKLQGRRTILIVDHSASMNVNDGTTPRLERAKSEARRWIRSLRARDEMAIISSSGSARVCCGLTSHQRTLRDAVARIPETDGPTGVQEAIRLGRRLLADHENGRVVILSDGGFTDDDQLSEDDDVTLVQIGRPTDNTAITRFQVRRSLLDLIGYQVLLEVTNFSERPVECRLELELGEALVDVIPLTLAPEERWTRVLDHTSAAGGVLSAKLDTNDALAGDNRAVAILPEREMQPVLLVTEGNLFLQRVLEAIPIVQLEVADQLPEQVPAGALLVFHRAVPEQLPQGNLLVVDPAGSCDLWTAGEAVENPIVTDQDADSRLMTHVRLDNVIMPGAKKLEFQSEIQVLASSVDGDPLYCAVERPSGKALVMTADLDKGDLPLRTAFPILVTNALNWFRDDRGQLRQSAAAGALMEVDLPSHFGSDLSQADLVLTSPDDSVSEISWDEDGQAVVGPLDRCGVWSIRPRASEDTQSATSEPMLVACNLTDQDESNLMTAPDASAAGQSALAGFGGRPIWFYLAALAFLLVVVEWTLYQRRWVG